MEYPFYKRIEFPNNIEIEVGEGRSLDLLSEPFSSAVSKFEVLEIVDYLGGNYGQTNKRIYLLKSNRFQLAFK
jgi:hypothetical protein